MLLFLTLEKKGGILILSLFLTIQKLFWDGLERFPVISGWIFEMGSLPEREQEGSMKEFLRVGECEYLSGENAD